MTEQEYIEQRLDEQMNFFAQKSKINKTNYVRTKVLIIVLSASLPLATKYSDVPSFPAIISFIGVLIAILSGLDALFNYHESWVNYRKVREVLKREKFLYLTKSGPYQGNPPFQQFVTNIEAIMSTENAEWFNLNNHQQQNSHQVNPDVKEGEEK
ncbi:DUF4231 domain-containing protein [Arcicella sp. DC2W]|uniref:DUF4231 domain-containing protein n=1 Tax=Arcicella gelida TaxID=2984195 RepID=A0ABU5S1D8_9BACT|nr:DUF4231 domain-containing protein [Arcicella sp. DC2W]MEA5402257.1 DUF4231 domain-containing protein [Arcicella sp. DC2W]